MKHNFPEEFSRYLDDSYYDRKIIQPGLEQTDTTEDDLEAWHIVGVVKGPLRTDTSLSVRLQHLIVQLPRAEQTVYVVFRDSQRRLHLRAANTLPSHLHWQDYPDFEMTPAEFARLMEEDDTMEGHEHAINNDRKQGAATQITWVQPKRARL